MSAGQMSERDDDNDFSYKVLFLLQSHFSAVLKQDVNSAFCCA